jgi:hypothetical protein
MRHAVKSKNKVIHMWITYPQPGGPHERKLIVFALAAGVPGKTKPPAVCRGLVVRALVVGVYVVIVARIPCDIFTLVIFERVGV